MVKSASRPVTRKMGSPSPSSSPSSSRGPGKQYILSSLLLCVGSFLVGKFFRPESSLMMGFLATCQSRDNRDIGSTTIRQSQQKGQRMKAQRRWQQQQQQQQHPLFGNVCGHNTTNNNSITSSNNTIRGFLSPSDTIQIIKLYYQRNTKALKFTELLHDIMDYARWTQQMVVSVQVGGMDGKSNDPMYDTFVGNPRHNKAGKYHTIPKTNCRQ